MTRTVLLTPAANGEISYRCIRDWPNQVGYVNDGTHVQLTGTQFTALTYAAPAYFAYHGALVTKIIPIYFRDENFTAIAIRGGGTSDYMFGGLAMSAAASNFYLNNTTAGSVAGRIGGVRNELCWSNYWADPLYFKTTTSQVNDWQAGVGVMLVHSSLADNWVAVTQAINDDFQFLLYMGPPLIYTNTLA